MTVVAPFPKSGEGKLRNCFRKDQQSRALRGFVERHVGVDEMGRFGRLGEDACAQQRGQKQNSEAYHKVFPRLGMIVLEGATGGNN
jgi:hypothetical protein